MPKKERFQHAPLGACFKQCPSFKITSFVVDSSRSRRLYVLVVRYFVYLIPDGQLFYAVR